MSKINDGGPAHPVFPETGNGHAAAIHGLSVRQWYAGQALAGVRIGDWCSQRQVAAHCFGMADALLAHEASEREGGQ